MKKLIINVKDNKIFVHESEGREQSVLLIHGNSLSSKSFNKQLEGSLGKRFRLIAIDLPGHGDSAPAIDPRETYSLPGYAKIVVSALEQLEFSNLVLVGHSLGGHIALELIDMLVDLKGVFIFGTPPLGIPPAVNQAYLDPRFNPSLLIKEGEEVPQMFIDDFNNTDPKARNYMMRNTAKNNFKDEIEIVSSMKIPLAIIHGTCDRLINLDYINKIELPTLWKNKVHIIENSGHSPQWETPDEFNSILREFLENLMKKNNTNQPILKI
ncbi:MAG: alpha/beta fold hydrolase [Promethearchaeota archaeon]